MRLKQFFGSFLLPNVLLGGGLFAMGDRRDDWSSKGGSSNQGSGEEEEARHWDSRMSGGGRQGSSSVRDDGGVNQNGSVDDGWWSDYVPAGARAASSSARSRSPPPVAPMTPGVPRIVAPGPYRSDNANRSDNAFSRWISCAFCSRLPVHGVAPWRQWKTLSFLAAHGIPHFFNLDGVSISTQEQRNICACCTDRMLLVHGVGQHEHSVTGRVHLCPGCGLRHGEPVTSNPSGFWIESATVVTWADEPCVASHRCATA